MRRRQRQTRPAADRVNGLHERFSKRRLANDIGAIVILEGPRDDLGGARAVAVRNHHDWNFGELTLLGCAVGLIGIRHPPLGVNDHLAARKELVRDFNGLIEGAARIAANIQEQPPHAFRGELA